jgi:hypothetical protein
MPIMLNVKATQILPKVSAGWRAQQNFYVDDSYTKGLTRCKFVGVISGKVDGKDEPVFTYAGHVGATYTTLADAPIAVPAVKAIGILYESSPIDAYRRLDDTTDENQLFPKGKRQDKPMPPMPYSVLEVTDTDRMFGDYSYFRKVDATIEVGDIVSFTDATAEIVLAGNYTTSLRLEEKLEIDGGFYYITAMSYDAGAGETTLTLNEGAGDVVLEIIVKSPLFDPVYLADDMTGLPFTMIPSTDRQKLGFVESTIAVRVKIEL